MLDLSALLPPLAFVAVFLATWAASTRWFRARSGGAAIGSASGRADDRCAAPAFGEPLERLVQARILKPILRPRTELDEKRLRLELTRAGFNTVLAVPCYLALRLAGAAGGFVLATGAHVGICGLSLRNVLVGAGGAAFGFLLPKFLLHWLQNYRQRELRNALPDALDLLAITISCGRGLDGAIRSLAQELPDCAPVLVKELRLFCRQVDLGRSRRDALHDLAMRSGVDEMACFTNTLIQAQQFGTEVASALADLASFMRIRRSQRAEELAQKSAVKLLLPLIVCIFPGIFVTLVGPAAVLIMRDILSLR